MRSCRELGSVAFVWAARCPARNGALLLQRGRGRGPLLPPVEVLLESIVSGACCLGTQTALHPQARPSSPGQGGPFTPGVFPLDTWALLTDLLFRLREE